MCSETEIASPTADPRDSYVEEPGLGLIDPATGEIIVPAANAGGEPIPATRGQGHGKRFEQDAIRIALGVADYRPHPTAPMDLPAELSPTGMAMSFKAKGGDALAPLDSGDACRALLWDSHTLVIASWEQVAHTHKGFFSVLEIDVDMSARDEDGRHIVLGSLEGQAETLARAKALTATTKGKSEPERQAIAARIRAMLAPLEANPGALRPRLRVGSRERRLQVGLDPRELIAAGFASRSYRGAYRGMELPRFIRSSARSTRLTKIRHPQG